MLNAQVAKQTHDIKWDIFPKTARVSWNAPAFQAWFDVIYCEM